MCLINDDVLVLMLHTQRVEATLSMCLLCADIVESSANISTMHSLNTSGRSLIYTKNSVGPSTEPCGTPETIKMYGIGNLSNLLVHKQLVSSM